MCTPAAYAVVRELVSEHSRAGVLQGRHVASYLQRLLGEDLQEGGVTVAVLRSRLRPYLSTGTQALAVTLLPAILQDFCAITLSTVQCNDLPSLASSGEAADADAPLVALHTGEPPSSAHRIVPLPGSRDEALVELAAARKALVNSARRERYWWQQCERFKDALAHKEINIYIYILIYIY